MIPVPARTLANGTVCVWLATGHTGMRKGFSSLAVLVQEKLQQDPHTGDDENDPGGGAHDGKNKTDLAPRRTTQQVWKLQTLPLITTPSSSERGPCPGSTLGIATHPFLPTPNA